MEVGLRLQIYVAASRTGASVCAHILFSGRQKLWVFFAVQRSLS